VTDTYVAVDPGKANGLAGFDDKGHVKWLQVVQLDQLSDFLDKLPETVTTCICEDFRLYPNMAHKQGYSPMDATRGIGVVMKWCQLRGIKLVMQMPSVKSTGFMFLGKKEPKRSAVSHSVVAHAHGVYWLVTNGILDPKELLKK
jgi:hypothetical protein